MGDLFPTMAAEVNQGKSMISPGTLLVSHPKFAQGIFGRSVVLITEHHEQQTVGFIVNKPTKFKVKDIIDNLVLDEIAEQPVYSGGPIRSRAVCVIHSDEWYSSSTMQICSGMAMTSDHLMIEKFNMGNWPVDYLIAVGAATWHPGQLANELTENNASRHALWLTTQLKDCSMVFDCPADQMWNHCLTTCTREIVSQYF